MPRRRHGPIDWQDPVARDHKLNQGLVAWWLGTEPLAGGPVLWDIAGRNHAALLPAATAGYTTLSQSSPAAGTSYPCYSDGDWTVTLNFSAFALANGDSVTLSVNGGSTWLRVRRDAGGNYYFDSQANGTADVTAYYLGTSLSMSAMSIALNPATSSTSVVNYGVGGAVYGGATVPRLTSVSDASYTKSAAGVTAASLTMSGTYASPTATAGVPWVPDGRGFAGLRLNGSQYATFPDARMPSGTSPRCITAWVRTTTNLAFNTYQSVFGYGTPSTSQAVFLFQSNDGTVSGNLTAVSQYGDATGGGAVNDGRLHLVATDFDGSTWRVYVDGVLTASKAMSTNTVLGGTACIGSDISGNKWTGDIADVRVYSRTLAAADHWGLYDQSRRGHPDTLQRYTPRTFFVPASPPPVTGGAWFPFAGAFGMGMG